MNWRAVVSLPALGLAAPLPAPAGDSIGGGPGEGPSVVAGNLPRPMLLFAGETDPLFTAAGVGAAHAKMRAVWQSQRAGDRLTTKIWPGLGHVFVREMQDEAFAWLDRRLRP